MSELLPINVNDRLAVSTATASQTVFSYDFPIQDESDITVIKQDGGTGVSTVLALSTHYTVSGVGAESGGSITLTTGATAGDIYTRVGTAVLQRVLSIVRSGKYKAKATDADLDRAMIIAQELARDVERAWKAGYGVTGGLINAGAAGTVAKFDNGGNLVEGPSIGEIAAAYQNAQDALAAAERAENAAASVVALTNFKTVAQLLADNNTMIGYTGSAATIIVAAGDCITAAGFRYEVATVGSTNSHLTTAGGVKLYVLPTPAHRYNILAFGAVGDNATDNISVFSKIAALGGNFIIPAGIFCTSGTIIPAARTCLFGDPGSSIKQVANNTPIFKSVGFNDVVVSGILFVGIGSSDTASTVNAHNNTVNAQAIGLWIDSADGVYVNNNKFLGFKNNGIRIAYSRNVHVLNNYISGTHPDSDIPLDDASHQQFGIVIYAEDAAKKGESIVDVVVNGTADRHDGENIFIVGNTIGNTAIAICIFPGFSNVVIQGNATFGTLSQHSIYAYPYEGLLIQGNFAAASQAVGIKVSYTMDASYYTPKDIRVDGNIITNCRAPSISFEVFDKDLVGGFDVDKSTVWFQKSSITNNTITNGNDYAMVLACMFGDVTGNRIEDFSQGGVRELINLRSFGGTISDNKLKNSSYGALGGTPSLFDPLILSGNRFEEVMLAAAGYYASLGKAPTPIAFKTSVDRYINYYSDGVLISNNSTGEVYRVVGSGVAGDIAPTGSSPVISGDVTFNYVGVYSSLTTNIELHNNKFLVGETTMGTGAISINDAAFAIWASDNYADQSLRASVVYGTVHEWSGNNLYNNSKGSITLAPNAVGTGANHLTGTAAPTTGSHNQGDICWRFTPTVDVNNMILLGWICTSTGAPGTWHEIYASAVSPAT